MISIAHWSRLEEGALFAWSSRLEWAVMMKRTWGFNVLACPRCTGKMRVIATITTRRPPAIFWNISASGPIGSRALPHAPPPMEQMDLEPPMERLDLELEPA
jgi:hypothetical protein